MKRTPRNYLMVGLALLLVMSFTATAAAQDARTQAEPLIRTAVYESTIAALNGDIKLYRSRMARRTYELYRLIFEGFKEVPDYAATLTENKMDSVDKFIETNFKLGATHWATLSAAEKEQRARATSNARLTFLNDREAILDSSGSAVRVVFEDNTWKVDETEGGKKMFLENFQFTAATRAKIEKL